VVVTIPCPADTEGAVNIWVFDGESGLVTIDNSCQFEDPVELSGKGIPNGRLLVPWGLEVQIKYPGPYSFTADFKTGQRVCAHDRLMDPACACTATNDREYLFCSTIPKNYASFVTTPLAQNIIKATEEFNSSTTSVDLFGWLTGNLSEYSSSIPTATGRSLDTESLDEASLSPVSLSKREINTHSTNPLLAAIAIVGVFNLQGCRQVIRNKFPARLEGKYVTGLSGILLEAVTIAGKTFVKGSTWIIRYDFAGLNAKNGLSGAHVNVAIGKGMLKESWGLYLQSISPFGTRAWYESIVAALTNLVANEGLSQEGEALAVQNFWAELWDQYHVRSDL
jgi:hypothetical protein